MWPNYPGTELVRTAFNLKIENDKFTVRCSRSQPNSEVTRFTLLFVEDGEEMNQNLYRTSRAFVLLITTIFSVTYIVKNMPSFDMLDKQLKEPF